MSLIPFNPPLSIYHDVTAERLMHGFVVPELGFSDQTGLDRTVKGVGSAGSTTYGDWVRLVFSDTGGDFVNSSAWNPEAWKVLVQPDQDVLDGLGTPGGRTYGTAPMDHSTIGWDTASAAVRVEGSKVAVWVSCYEFDGMGGAAWSSWVKVKPGDGDVNLGLTNGADYHRVYIMAKP